MIEIPSKISRFDNRIYLDEEANAIRICFNGERFYGTGENHMNNKDSIDGQLSDYYRSIIREAYEMGYKDAINGIKKVLLVD